MKLTDRHNLYQLMKIILWLANHLIQLQKLLQNQLAISYFQSFGLPVKIVRPFNTYGPRQSLRAIIPTIISQILEGKKEIELGNLSPTRDLTFVLDTCNSFIDIYSADCIFWRCS